MKKIESKNKHKQLFFPIKRMSLEKLIDRKFYQLNTNVSESVNASRGSIPPSNSNQLASSSSAKQSDRINSNLIPNASKDPNPALQVNISVFLFFYFMLYNKYIKPKNLLFFGFISRIISSYLCYHRVNSKQRRPILLR